MTEVICASLLPEADSSTSNLCSSLPRGCSCKAKRSLLGKQDRDFLKAGCHVLMPWHSAPQYPCCSLEVTFIFSTVKFDAEAAPGDEVSGFPHARTCSTLPLSALLSYPRGPHSPPLPSLLELGAGGLRGDGRGAAQPRAHLRVAACSAAAGAQPSPSWELSGLGLAVVLPPAPVGTSSFANRKVFRTSFQTMLKTIFLFVCFSPEMSYIPKGTPV